MGVRDAMAATDVEDGLSDPARCHDAILEADRHAAGAVAQQARREHGERGQAGRPITGEDQVLDLVEPGPVGLQHREARGETRLPVWIVRKLGHHLLSGLGEAEQGRDRHGEQQRDHEGRQAWPGALEHQHRGQPDGAVRPHDEDHQQLLQGEARRGDPVDRQDEAVVAREGPVDVAQHLERHHMGEQQRRRRDAERELHPIGQAHRERAPGGQRGKAERRVGERRREQQRLARSGLPRREQEPASPFDGLDGNEAERQVQEVAGHEGEQHEARHEADASRPWMGEHRPRLSPEGADRNGFAHVCARAERHARPARGGRAILPAPPAPGRLPPYRDAGRVSRRDRAPVCCRRISARHAGREVAQGGEMRCRASAASLLAAMERRIMVAPAATAS